MKVLLVDDHPLFLEGLRNLLMSEGIQVAGLAHDGMEALSEARHLHPDLILMDIQMPRCDGVTATRLIKAEMPEIKIVMLTMFAEDKDLFEAVKSGASGYLLKQLDAEEFFSYLAELQAGHPPFSPGLAEKILDEFTRQAARTETPSVQPEADEAPLGVQAGGVQAEDRRADQEQDRAPSLSVLSPRQIQILTLVAQGHTYQQVAETIGITERTVKYHMAEILNRLHMKNRAQVIAYAAHMGLSRTGS